MSRRWVPPMGTAQFVGEIQQEHAFVLLHGRFRSCHRCRHVQPELQIFYRC